MQKIAAIFDGFRFSESTLHYAIWIAAHQGAHLTGVFPDDLTYNSFNLYQLLKEGTDQAIIGQLEEEDEERRKAAAGKFEAACQKAGIPYSVHRNKNISLLSALEESIYADLLVIDVRETFMHDVSKPPTRFIRDLLTDVQCPVLIVPAQISTPPVFSNVTNMVLLYDGEPSSVYAIKMYSYLFSSWQSLPTTVLSVNPEGTHFENKHLIKDFIRKHFPDAVYKIMEGEPEEEIVTYLLGQQEGTAIVLGAYRRSSVSRWFRRSMADLLMQALSFPLFIAHNK
ncbi:nucleotide-binding universal stress UspA family protein [Chitinophaga polysaccharea]|uniref:Nucleotide-binding universal stress UspA family protein n=1 Tax=Chitinophaga polysaccharea TaxID=1293035 RepID=A0A561PRA9_9BACT|nr:universal stress protein [Chitinophaga polysaccharea]TWF40623.1 nucleotide-binding universal stress UspA family protein [Chitinophaga polysaccharea]